jgi:signal transduction histidine kinase
MRVRQAPPGRWLLTALTVVGLWSADGTQAAAEPKHVLVFYSTSRDAPMANAGEDVLPRILGQGVPDGVTYFPEYIDQGRFPEPTYEDAFSEFLRVKYHGRRIDLIIAIQAGAAEFVRERRDLVFPGTPVVFLTFSQPPSRLPNSTGVVVSLDLSSTLALALELQPDLRNVFVVSGAGAPAREYERLARTQLQPFEAQLTVTFLAGLPTSDLETRLKTLPDHSMVYYLVAYQDGAGQAVAPMFYGEWVSEVARAPTYSWSDALMDHGIVGGSLLDRQAMMAAAGELSIRVLKGEAADGIAMVSPDLNVNQVDWRQLQRWRISEARVPSGTVVSFRELSAWERYKIYILGAAAIVIAQTTLIGGLLVQRARRRRAESQVLQSEGQLRASHDRIRDLGARLLNAQDTERARIARELHDDVSQQMALLEIDLELMGKAAEGRDKIALAEAAARIHGIGRSVHDLSHRLHPARLRLVGLMASIEGLLRESSHSDIAVSLTHANVPPQLPPEVTLCLFRIVQEALHNAIKYSKARHLSVDVRGDPEGLTLNIADDGVGFAVDEAWSKGLGLISMRERVEAIGGSFDLRSGQGGTRIAVRAPSHRRAAQPSRP